jgi:Copper type II ascorbate-dependent monooxygenase, C-terminal domain
LFRASATRDGSSGRLEPLQDETCYEFRTHASTERVDDAPYQVEAGESYEQFYFRAPWPNGSVATGFATVTDNIQVLHHWFLFSTNEDQADGFHLTSPLPTLIGTNPHMIAAWSSGGTNLVPPDDVGFELPAQGSVLNLQWSYSNSTGQAQPDASSVQICVTPGSKRARVANVTWLGTEDLGGNEWFGGEGMPAHQVSTFSTSCTPGRAGLRSSDPIHIVGFQPHMQRLGTRMETDVQHVNGTSETLFDEPFNFGDERHYFKSYDLQPGETLTTSCMFNNTTDNGVPYGTSSEDEMCYQFVFAYPVGALTNGAASLLGQSDTCW